MAKVVMYCTAVCPYCVRAEQLLMKKGVQEIEKVRIDQNPDLFEEMLSRSQGRRTVPQIFIGDTHVGGYDDMVDLDMDDALMPLLEA
jgi:glutaredoxin 3